MITNTYSHLPGKTHNGDSMVRENHPQAGWRSRDLTPLLHRRAVEIHQRIRTIRAQLTTRSERDVFDYIVDSTIGRNKDTDQIANSQFMQGKRCSKTSRVLDFGCGLRSINTIRKARKLLIAKGVIFEASETDITGASQANRYGLVFIRELLELIEHKAVSTRRGYQKMTPTIKSSSKIKNQRCMTTAKIPKKQTGRRYHKAPEHVDYLIGMIEETTGDRHSRGAFAEIALTVDEGVIMELLAILRDRDNINNSGAWFLVAAKKYQKQRIIRADVSTQPSEKIQPLPANVSLKEKLMQQRPELAGLLDMNKKLHTSSVHPKVLVGQ